MAPSAGPLGLWTPQRPQLVRPDALLHALAARPDLIDRVPTSDGLRRLLLQQLDAIATGDAAWALLTDDESRMAMLGELLGRRRSSRLVWLPSTALITPSRAAVAWSLPRRPELRSALNVIAVDPGAVALGRAGLTLPIDTPLPFELPARPDDAHSVHLSAALLPGEPMAPARGLRRPQVVARKHVHRGPSPGFWRIGAVAGVAAAFAVALVLPSRPSATQPPARAAAAVTARPPGMTPAAIASPLLAVPAAGAARRAVVTLFRVTPVNPLVTASLVPRAAPSPRDSAPAPASAPLVHPDPSVPLPATAERIGPPAMQTTRGPRESVARSRRRTEPKKRAIAAAARKHPDVATLVLPDALKPH